MSHLTADPWLSHPCPCNLAGLEETVRDRGGQSLTPMFSFSQADSEGEPGLSQLSLCPCCPSPTDNGWEGGQRCWSLAAAEACGAPALPVLREWLLALCVWPLLPRPGKMGSSPSQKWPEPAEWEAVIRDSGEESRVSISVWPCPALCLPWEAFD